MLNFTTVMASYRLFLIFSTVQYCLYIHSTSREGSISYYNNLMLLLRIRVKEGINHTACLLAMTLPLSFLKISVCFRGFLKSLLVISCSTALLSQDGDLRIFFWCLLWVGSVWIIWSTWLAPFHNVSLGKGLYVSCSHFFSVVLINLFYFIYYTTIILRIPYCMFSYL